jgi:hypothetical protein
MKMNCTVDGWKSRIHAFAIHAHPTVGEIVMSRPAIYPQFTMRIQM